MAGNEKKSGIEQIADEIIAALEKGVAPWQQPWSASALSSLLPENPTTKASYRGANRLLLALQRRSDNRWLTFNQAKEKGWKIKKGEKGVPIVKFVDHEFSKEIENEQGEKEIAKEKALVAKTYFVFNGEQIDGIPPLEKKEAAEIDLGRADSMIEALVERTGLSVRYGGDRAFYSPGADLIQMPARESFHSAYDAAATLLHEAAHSTLHEKRIDRKDALGRFGSEAYAMEELRAEIASFFLAGMTGISQSAEQSEKHLQSHAGYCGSWIKALKDDKREIIRACADAERICDFIVNNEQAFLAENGDSLKQGRLDAALLEAARAKDAESVAKCLAEGANANARGEWGWTPLHRATWNAGGEEAALVLLQAGADPNAETSEAGDLPGSRKAGTTPFSNALNFDLPRVAEAMIRAGADEAKAMPWEAERLATESARLRAFVEKGAIRFRAETERGEVLGETIGKPSADFLADSIAKASVLNERAAVRTKEAAAIAAAAPKASAPALRRSL